MAIIYVIIPGTLVLVYGHRNVKLTCQARDPKTRWTDKCPLPVLATATMCGLGSTSVFGQIFYYNGALPLFGYWITGIAGTGLLLAIPGLMVWLAWGNYKLKVGTWWATVGLAVFGGVSNVITFSKISMLELYEKSNMPAEQIDIMRQSGYLEDFNIALYTGLLALGTLGYLLFTKKYYSNQQNIGTVANLNL